MYGNVSEWMDVAYWLSCIGKGLVQTVENPKGLSGNFLPSRGPEGNQTFPRGAALRESLISLSGQIFQTIPKDFPIFV